MSILRILPKLLQTWHGEHLSDERLNRIQSVRLRKLLRHALTKSKFYSDLYYERGITKHDVDEVGLAELPTVDKDLIMHNFQDVVCKSDLRREQLEAFISDPRNIGRKYLGKYSIIHTSGSSGRIGLFVYGPAAWAQAKAISFSRVARFKTNPLKADRYAFIGAINGNFAAVSLSRDVPSVIAQTLCISVNAPLDSINKKVNDFQPSILAGYASAVLLLAQQQLKGSIHIRPRRIVCGGDPLTSVMRDMIGRAFGCEPYDSYGATEFMIGGIECEEYHRHHIFEDWVICEVLDDELHPVKAGIPGQLYITNLYNYTQPLIRYKMNDEMTLSGQPCECGRASRVLERIAGRKEEFLWFVKPDGSREFIHPIVLAEFFVPGLEKCQFIQESSRGVLVKAVVTGDSASVTSAIRERMKTILRDKSLSDCVAVRVELTDTIENDRRTGKFRLVVPLHQQQGP